MSALSKFRVVVAALFGWLAASVAQAGTITVTHNLTYPDMNGTTCTLSQAIAAANLANGVTPDSVGSATTAVGFDPNGFLNPGADKLGNCAGATSGANSIVFAPVPALAGATLTYTTADFSTTPWNSGTGTWNGMSAGRAFEANNLADNYWYGLNALPPIASTISINGGSAGITLEIALAPTTSPPPGTHPRLRFFYVSGGLTGVPGSPTGPLPAGSLSLQNMTLTGGRAWGGMGGGGGAGMGGAIFNQGTLNLSAVTLTSNSAIGGRTLYGVGGGGMADRADNQAGGGMGGAISAYDIPNSRNFLGGFYGGRGGLDAGGGGGFVAGSNGGDGAYGAGGGLGGLGGCGGMACYGDGGVGGIASINDGGGFGFGSQGTGSSSGGGGVGSGGAPGAGGGFGGGGGSFGFGGFGGGGGLGGFGGGDNGGPGAGMGGAIFNHRGSLNLTNVTMTGNTASGGAANGSGLGAAIFNLNGTVTIAYSTLANNAVSGSNIAHEYIFANGFEEGFSTNTHSPGDATVYSVAYGNKIENGTASLAALTITGSIISGTVASNGAGNNDVVNNVVRGTHPANTGNVATLTYSGKNIIGASWNVGSGTGATATQNGAPTSNADPMLGALANNGGPTQTQLPQAGSAAINAIAPVAGNCAVSTDQRGVPRPIGGGCDIGAVEQ